MIVKDFIHDPPRYVHYEARRSVILGYLIGGALSSCKARVCQSFTSLARSFQWESFLQSEAHQFALIASPASLSDTTLACSSVPDADEPLRPTCLVFYRHNISVFRTLLLAVFSSYSFHRCA